MNSYKEILDHFSKLSSNNDEIDSAIKFINNLFVANDNCSDVESVISNESVDS